MSSDGQELAGGTNPDGGLSDTAKRYLAGQTGRDYRCQIGVGCHTPFSAPWRGAQRESDKTQLFRYVRSRPDGVPLSKIVGDVFGQDAVEAAGGDYQLARRFFDRHDCFLTARRDGYLWVEPTVAAFHLSLQYANRKKTGRRGGGVSNADSRVETGGQSSGGVDGGAVGRGSGGLQYPKDRAQSVLSKRVVLDGSDGGHDYRADLLRELGTERVVQSDKFKILRRTRGKGDDYLLLPYTTKFNSGERAAGTARRFNTALKTAAGRYTDGVMLTLTTDPGRHESLTAAISGLSDAKNRLLSWLATDSQLGHRPDNLTVLEFTDKGLPHVHLVLFGISWAVHQGVLSQKWADYGQGEIVDARGVRSRDGSDRWYLRTDGVTVTLGQYLGKSVEGLREVAQMDADAVREAAEAGDTSLWRQALYWATGRQHVSCSPSLKDTGGGDGLPHVPVYEFVGVSKYRDLPAHVRQQARVFVDRGSPPPDSGGQSGVG